MRVRRQTTATKDSKKRSKQRQKPIWKKTSQQLTPRQRRLRRKSLDALSLVRRMKISLHKAAQQTGTNPATIRRNTNAFRKVKNRWKAKLSDTIPRTMLTYENGRTTILAIPNSKTASQIGQYHNSIKQFLNTGKSSILKKLPKKKFRDKKGNLHALETRPKAIFRIKSRETKPEFFEIYRQR